MKIKEDCDHGSETGRAHCVWSEKEGASKETLGTWKIQMGSVRCDVKIAVLAITDFGTNWGERAWDRISGHKSTSFGK